MSVHGRLRIAVVGSALTLALSTFGASPVQADDQQPPGLEVEMPADLEITEATEVPEGSEPSSGAGTHPCIGYTATYASAGCFQPYGDVFYATDLLADGKSAAVGVFTDHGRAKQACVVSLGAGKTGKCDWDYWEEGNVQLQVLLYDRTNQHTSPRQLEPLITTRTLNRMPLRAVNLARKGSQKPSPRASPGP